MRPLTTYYCKCDSVDDSSFPIIEIHTNTKTFNFRSRDYLIYEYVPEQDDAGRCMVSFQVLAESPVSSFWLLGASFLRSTYTVYDVANKKIGFVGDFSKTEVLPPLRSLSFLPMMLCCCCACGMIFAIIGLMRAK